MKHIKLVALGTMTFLSLVGFGSQVSADEIEHIVSTTDTLSAISLKYFDSVEFVDQIAADNEIENPDLIFDGEKLLINTDKKTTNETKVTNETKTATTEETTASEHSGTTLTMEATAYSAEEGGTLTATGQNLLENPMAIAVDPSVIPLGTRLYVEGYGEAVAVDTGGAIKGNIIDVHFPTIAQCIQWGRRSVQVTILD